MVPGGSDAAGASPPARSATPAMVTSVRLAAPPTLARVLMPPPVGGRQAQALYAASALAATPRPWQERAL